MDARSKRREATRRQLEQQLKERQAREARRRRATLISSIVGTVALVALVVVLIAVFAGGNDPKKKNQDAGASAASSTAPTSTAPTTSAAPLAAPAACAAPTGKPTASFDGVTVANATNLKSDPKVTSKSAATLKALACDDLVVGTGKAATTSSTVSVQYSGVLYKNGTKFDSSWARGQAASFSLKTGPGGVIAGFSQGIGGTGKVTPMRVGGRRIIVMPAQLAYGASGSGSVPPNADLVFVVDLLKVS